MKRIGTAIIGAVVGYGMFWLTGLGAQLWKSHNGFWWGTLALCIYWIAASLLSAVFMLQWNNFVVEGDCEDRTERVVNGVFALASFCVGCCLGGNSWSLMGLGGKMSWAIGFGGIASAVFLIVASLVSLLTSIVPAIDTKNLTKNFTTNGVTEAIGMVALLLLGIRCCVGGPDADATKGMPAGGQTVRASVVERTESKDVITAEDIVRSDLAKLGIGVGYNTVSKDVVVIGTYEAEVEDVSKIDEAFRQIAYRKALIEMFAECGSVLSEKLCKNDKTYRYELVSKKATVGDGAMSDGVEFTCSGTIMGLEVIAAAESYDVAHHVYQVSLAGAWSPHMQDVCMGMETGKIVNENREGENNIDDWVNGFVELYPLGSRTLVDNVGNRWFVGTVTVDDSMRRYVEKWCDGPEVSGEHKLQAYALDGIAKGIKSDVSCYTTLGTSFREHSGSTVSSEREDSSKDKGLINPDRGLGEDFENLHSTKLSGDKLVSRVDFGDDAVGAGQSCSGTLLNERQVHARFAIDSQNPRVKWFKRKAVNPFSGKEIEVWIGAVRANDLAAGERELYEQKAKDATSPKLNAK